MINGLYNIGMFFFQLFIFLASFFNNKAKLHREGRKNWKQQITKDKFAAVIDDMLNAQKDNYTACYVSAAIIRGWEVYDNIDDLKPHVDERQEEMAERMFKKFFFRKLTQFSQSVFHKLR